MRLINLIVLVWRYKHDIQRQYEDALPQTVPDYEKLAQLADLPPKVSKDGTIDYSLNGVDLGYLKKDDSGNLILGPGPKINPIVRDDDCQPMIRRGEMPAGGRRHNGVLAFEWLADRLKKLGIDIGIEESEFAALDGCHSENVSVLSAELMLEDHDLNSRIAADRDWVKAIEERPDNEAIAEALVDELGRQFGFEVAPEPEPAKALGVEVVEPIPVVMPKSEEIVEIVSR